MKIYALSIVCPNKQCWNLNKPVTLWLPQSSTNHPCGACGEAIEVKKILEEKEVPDIVNPVIEEGRLEEERLRQVALLENSAEETN